MATHVLKQFGPALFDQEAVKILDKNENPVGIILCPEKRNSTSWSSNQEKYFLDEAYRIARTYKNAMFVNVDGIGQDLL